MIAGSCLAGTTASVLQEHKARQSLSRVDELRMPGVPDARGIAGGIASAPSLPLAIEKNPLRLYAAVSLKFLSLQFGICSEQARG